MRNPLYKKRRFELLEDRRVLSASAAASLTQTAYTNLVEANVAGESIFYNSSAITGNNASSNSAADAAIDTSKSALLPGQTATAANYTTNAAGINGLMIDVTGLPSNVTASDFVFTVGNSSDPTTWTQLSVQPTVIVRWGQGVNGSARVEITFPDDSIQNEWLQVTVLANADTGLSANDVFYYGNTTTGVGTSPNQLTPFSAPVTPATTPFVTEQPAFMEAQGYTYYFFDPLITETTDGTLIAVAEARTENYDAAVPSIAETTSTNGGQTWSPISMLYTLPSYPTNDIQLGSFMVDQKTGTVFLTFAEDNNSLWVTSSANDGQTWTAPQNISSTTMQSTWGWVAPGPDNGVQLTVGPDAGRLMFAIDYRYSAGNTGISFDAVIYSDNDGATWQLGGGPDSTNPANGGANEATLVQLPSGALLMNSRVVKGPNGNMEGRDLTYSYDGGMTWSTEQFNQQFDTPSCEGSMIELDANTLLFAGPTDPDNTGIRQGITIWASFDGGQTWTAERTINYDYVAYSDMVSLGNDTALLAFDAGNVNAADETAQKIDLVKFNLTALESGQAPQFTWNFNEQPVGMSASIGGASIRDDGQWDERGTVQSWGGVPYFVPGNTGNEALQIVSGSNVNLSPTDVQALQFGAGQSFTFQFLLNTTSANGVLLGTTNSGPGYTFSLVNGAITLALNDGTNSVTISGSTIDDGNWHSVVGVRNAQTDSVSLYVDGTLEATAADPTGSLYSNNPVTLGAYDNDTSQLTMKIETVQATRAALTPSQFLPLSYVAPQTYPAPVTPADNVLNLPGLNFYLPPYDDHHYFADLNEADPLLVQPAAGTSARSAIDLTDKYYVQEPMAATVHYETSPVVGSYWSSQTGTGWDVEDSNGAQSPNQNFDFVQNTEKFTIAEVFNVPTVPANGSLELLGNNDHTSSEAGFDLVLNDDGSLVFQISNGSGTGTGLVNQVLATYAAGNTSVPQLSTGGWYQLVIVGNGPGTPLEYYLAPMTTAQIQQYQGTAPMIGIGVPVTTTATQDLQIANVSDASSVATPTLNFNDVAIFNQALTAAQAEQLFLDDSTQPLLTASGTVNTFTLGGAGVAIDPGLAASTVGQTLTGATVTISSGTLQAGDTLNFTNQNGIQGSYSGGVLTLSGTATVTQYQAALESVTFATTSTNTTPRSISIVASNQTLISNTATEQVDVTTTTPTLTASGTVNTFTVGSAAVDVDANLTAIPGTSELTGATVTISPGTLQAGDTLNFSSQSGIQASYAQGVLTLSGAATLAQYQAALDGVTFSTTSPNTMPRSLSVVALDGPLASNSAAEQVDVYLAPPVVTAATGGAVYLLGSSVLAIDPGLRVTSFDTTVTGATVTISPATLQPGDTLNFTSQTGIQGSYSGGVLTLSGTASLAAYQAALDSVTFTAAANVSTRSISVVVLDGGLVSDSAAEAVVVVKAAVKGSGAVPQYVAGTAGVTVDPALTVTAPQALSGASAVITNFQSGDMLSVGNAAGLATSFNSATGVLTLSGSGTAAQYQSALDTLTFSDSANPSTLLRSISILVSQGSTQSNVVVERVGVVAPVTVTGVYVAGSTWSDSGATTNFDGYLASHGLGDSSLPAVGYAIPSGRSQTVDLPWVNMNEISISFSGSVSNIGAGSLLLLGGTGSGAAAPPSVTGFTADGNNTYTWTLSGALGNNKYIVALATTGSSFGTSGSTQVTDASGAGISGTFTTGQAFPSGNGLAGSTFSFAFSVLPGDGVQQGIVNSVDAAKPKTMNSARVTSSTYSPYFDYNGAGLINTIDPGLATARNSSRQSGITAPTPPTVQHAGSSSGSAGFSALALASVESTMPVALSASAASGSANVGASNTSSFSAGLSSSSPAVTSPSAAAMSGSSSGTSSGKAAQGHGRHSVAATSTSAIDSAVSDFDLADLWA